MLLQLRCKFAGYCTVVGPFIDVRRAQYVTYSQELQPVHIGTARKALEQEPIWLLNYIQFKFNHDDCVGFT